MLFLSDNEPRVPQVFLNEEHIRATSDEIVKIFLAGWDEERYKREIGSQANPTDARLAIPRASTMSEVAEGRKDQMVVPQANASNDGASDGMAGKKNVDVKMVDDEIRREITTGLSLILIQGTQDDSTEDLWHSQRLLDTTGYPTEDEMPHKKDDDMILPGPAGVGMKIGVPDIMRQLMEFMPRADLAYRGIRYKNVFRGSEGIAAIMERFALDSKEDAVKFGAELQHRRILDHVKSNHVFGGGIGKDVLQTAAI